MWPRYSAERHAHCVTAQTASADATCGRVSRLAICTNHLLARARPVLDASGSLNTTRKSGDDVTTKPPAIACFPRGHAARMPGHPYYCPFARGRYARHLHYR